MDPNEALRLFAIALLEEDADDAREHYENIRTWLERGGFEPSWSTCSRKQFFTFNPSTGRIGE
jgi:hypothetical protein